METSQKFTCCVIGRTQLAINCSKVLLRRGILIQHIFTDDPHFQEWGNRLTITVNNTDYFQSLIKKEAYKNFAKFDYLFSIVNDIIIPHGVLSAVRKISINYHNGPLPKYGGANATNWALLSGEKAHGVVWHRMVEKVDSGEVLVRREVVIKAFDDLLSLNWKCWEAAMESFEELCHNLPCYQSSIISSSSVIYMYKAYEKPSAFCILPFECSAQEVHNFFRGTYLLSHEGNAPSTHSNEMGLPKLFLSDLNKMLVVTGINVLKEALIPNSIPGTVVSVADHLRITTRDHDVMITGLMEIDKSPIPKPFATSLPLRVGTNVHTPEAHDEGSYLWKLSRHSLVGKDERKWISQLNHSKLNRKESVPVLLWPYSMQIKTTDEMHSLSSDSKSQFLLCTIDNDFLSVFSESLYQPEVLVLTYFLCYLLLLTPTVSGSVDIRLSRIPNKALYLQSILHSVPASFQLLKEYSFVEAINHIGKKLSSCLYGELKSDVRTKTIASDIFLRYSLEPIKNELVVGIVEEGENLNEFPFDHKRVAILCSKNTKSININLVVSTVFPIGDLQTCKDSFMAFLESAIAMKGYPIFRHAILCSNDKASVLNGPKCDKDFPTWFHRPFEEIASKLPFRIAVVDETGQYTYQELNQKAEDIASVIHEKANGVKFDRIALLLDRTWLSLAATIASLKLGVAYVPLETESPTLFNCNILEDAKPGFLLVDDSEHWTQHWQEYAKCVCNIHVITLHDIPHSIRLLQQNVDSSLAKAAVLLYTSGTTGKPKGIIVNHKGLCNVINCVANRMGIQCCDSKDSMTEFSLYDASPTFDTCFLQVFPVLWNGGTVIVVPTDPLKPNRCLQFYSHVTFLSTTPRKLFLYKAEDFKCARNVAVGGEDPSMELYKKWEKANRTLWNLYGPAEISVITTMGIIKDQVHMGQAVDNSVLHILNPFQMPVPIGVPGELYILGDGVAQGYTCEILTKKAFGIDTKTEQRWYRSGDLVILNHNGILRYIGRIPSDKQVKIGGKRVEPLGIEFALKSFPGIEYAEVVVERPARNVNLVVAYVAPISVDVNALNSKLRSLFPEHMLPSLIIPVDLGDAELGRTGKIKLDKAKYWHKFAQTFHPPCSDLEKEVLANYREFLGISDNNILGMHDSFRTFGGDSIIAVSLADKIQHLLGWNIKPLDILEHTPAEIVAKYGPGLHGVFEPSPGIHNSNANLRQDSLFSSNKVPELDDAELSSMQQALLLMRTTQIGASYNIPIVFEITGHYDAFRLATTLESVLCCFPNCNTSIASVIPILSDIDLSRCLSNPKEIALQMIQKDACTPLDLKTSVYRCKIYYLNNVHCILSLVVHHIAFDYQSWNTLKSVIENSYLTGCTTVTLNSSRSSWINFVQSEHKQYELQKKETDKFWHDQLHCFPYFIPFPTSFSRPQFCQHRGRRALQRCEASLYQKLLYLCTALDVQPVCFILSIFALLIYSLSKQHKFCIAVVCSRRVNAKLKDTVGFVANTLICSFTSDILNRPFEELLEYTQSWHDKAQKHGCIPFSALVKIWGYESQPANHFPQFVLNCISDFKPQTFQLGDSISTTPITVDTYTSKAELLLDVTLSEELGLSFTWEYDTHIFTDEAIEHCIGKEYLTLLYQYFHYFGVKIDNPITFGESNRQLIKNWDLSDGTMDKSVVKPEPVVMLSCYQRAILDSIIQTPQSCWGYFNCICSFEVSQAYTKLDVQAAIEKVVESNVYLHYAVSAGHDYLQKKGSGIDVCYETVVNESEAEAINYRELLWPFDVLAGPLFHCTLVHNKEKRRSEVLISASMMLLDEQSLNLFCNLVHNALQTNVSSSLAFPHFSACSNHSQIGTETDSEYVGLLSIQPLSLMEVVQNYTSTNVTLDTMNFALPKEQIPALSCAIAAVLLRSLKQSAQVQLCFLCDCALKEQHLCSSESLMPVKLSVDQDVYFSNMVNAAHQELSKNSCPADYWSLQREFDPYSDYLHPHHEVLVQVVHSNHDFKLLCIRPFQLHLRFCADQKVITLASTLCPQQTCVVFSAFRNIVKALQSIQNLNILVADILLDVPLPPSIVQGLQLKVDKKSLRDVIITAINNKPDVVSYIVHDDKTMMVMTYRELLTQSKLLSASLQCIMKARESVNRCVAILVDGGFALPVAVVAAVLSNITFTIIDPKENSTAIAGMLKVVKPAIIIYDIHQFKTIQQLLEDEQMSSIVPALLDVFSEESCMLLSNPKEPLPTNRHAYVVFTSGSTGSPKATPISEDSFLNFLMWHETMIPIGRPLNWLQLSSLSFDICIAELLGQLYCGNTLFLSDLSEKLKLESYTFRIMSMFNVEGIHVVPTYLSYMLRQLDPSREHFPSLRHVFSTGEKLTKETCKSFFKLFNLASLHNWAGPSECCVETLHCALTYQDCVPEIPVGTPANNSTVKIVCPTTLKTLPKLIPGEVVISGTPVFDGYIQQCQTNPLVDIDGQISYRTGDVGYINMKGQVFLLNRMDTIKKINGQSVDLEGVRSLIMQLGISDVIDVIIDAGNGELVCFPVVSKAITEDYIQQILISELLRRYTPRVVKCLKQHEIPLLRSGKTNFKALREIVQGRSQDRTQKIVQGRSQDRTQKIVQGRSQDRTHDFGDILHHALVEIVPSYNKLNLANVTLDALGLSSMQKVYLFERLRKSGIDISVGTLLMNSLCDIIKRMNRIDRVESRGPQASLKHKEGDLVAILNLQVNVPGAVSCDKLWEVIVNCRDTVSHNLIQSSVTTGRDTGDQNGLYVGSRGLVMHKAMFDADLFNIPHIQAEVLDPQQRMLLQMVWTALEETGHAADKLPEGKRIGCFAGVQFPYYMLKCLRETKSMRDQDNVVWNNSRDNVALLIGRTLNFRGPCVTIANNCATFAVALHYARMSLISEECDVAVVAAGSVAPEDTGYYFVENDIYSSDGHCRPFSQEATGTVMSDGLTVAILKRLRDAQLDRDEILCIVKGSAVGSDGTLSGVTRYVPSAQGQAETLERVFESSHVDPSSVSLVEAHGTGTRVGDLIELESLTAVFKKSQREKKCILGSIKGNIGHTAVTAAGPSIIKAALALKHALLPPTMNCEAPIPELKESTCFEVIAKPISWPLSSSHNKKRALVHSVGAMGTNCAIILEEYQTASGGSKSSSNSVSMNRSECCYPFCTSAKTPSALNEIWKNLKRHVAQEGFNSTLKDISYTLIVGRMNLPQRSTAVVCSVDDIKTGKDLCLQSHASNSNMQICVMFSGQGGNVDDLSLRRFCEDLPCFSDEVHKCYKILSASYPKYESEFMNLAEGKSFPQHGSPFLQIYSIVFQVAMYTSLKALGIKASVVVGHSLGEYCAAFAAGVLSLQDMLIVVFERALLIEQVQYDGKMLRIDLSGEAVQQEYIENCSSLEIACYNSQNHCVVSGLSSEIENLCTRLNEAKVKNQVLLQGKAFHHSNLKQIESNFMKFLGTIKSQNVETNWVTSICGNCKLNEKGFLVPLEYWTRHLTSPVDFCSTCSHLYDFSSGIPLLVVEIGMQSSLRTLLSYSEHRKVFNFASVFTPGTSQALIQQQLCSLWREGVDVQWQKLLLFSDARRLKLPTYPFEMQSYWVSDSSAHCTITVDSTSHSQSQKNNSVESVLSSIREYTGYSDCLPEDSMLLMMLQNTIVGSHGVDISCLLREKKKTIFEITEYVLACTRNGTQDIHDGIKLLTTHTTSENKSPFFILHAVGGKLYSFHPLANSLSASFLTYGLYSSAAAFRYNTMESCAELYVSEIQKVQRHGPYCIGGFSFGAWMAHAVSKCLIDAGESVQLLVLIDPVPMDAMDELVLKQPTKFIQRVVSYGDLFVLHALQLCSAPAVVETFAQNFERQYQLLLKYKQSYKPLDSPVLILLAKDGIAIHHDKALVGAEHWNAVSKEEINVREIPGTHGTCIASSNCHHIANAMCNILKLPLERKAIPVCSDHEVQGVWKLKDIRLFSDGPEISDDVKKGQMKIVYDNYTCIATQIATGAQDEISVFMNSFGKIDILDQQTNFQIEASTFCPDQCPCKVTGSMTIDDCGILNIQISDYIMSFSKSC